MIEMKKIVLMVLALFALICLLATATAAQDQSEGMRTRSIRMKYDAGQVDGTAPSTAVDAGASYRAVVMSDQPVEKGEKVQVIGATNLKLRVKKIE